MLQIKEIRKQYITGDLVQTALDGVSLTLRENEFVAILGPSGSGKTTLLNVIGGLDRYDSGDLIINGISTKKYTDRDWDSYRNHTIGFIFQSYNLIPHQSVLANVELALTISGISRSERRRRAREALEAVGLGNQLHKRPNQMSGGQMQRVAIARALVNDPDILLADEPTGALDSETSVQVMDLLKEVAKDKLVVMVTHNPELAEEYANRIVRVKDGRIVDDTNPYQVDEGALEPPRHENMGRASMSFFTALALSFNNLWTKKARTLLTAFAGSIGIIGIALIMSLSTGFQHYIDKIQEDTLSNYPLTIQSETADMTAALSAMGSAAAQRHENREDGVLTEQQMIMQMFAQVGANDLASFKTHLDTNYAQIAHTVNAVQYSYGVKPQIYLADPDKKVTKVNPAGLFSGMAGGSSMLQYMASDVFYEMMDNIPLLADQYQVLQGRWPERWNEMVLVLSDPNTLSDYTAYVLGLRDQQELTDAIAELMSGKQPEDVQTQPMKWTYDELMALQLRLVPAHQRYRFNEEYGVWEDMSADESYMRQRIAEGEELKIVGIVCAKEGVSTTALAPGIAYLPGLTRKVMEQAADAGIVADQLENPEINVFTGKEFGDDTREELNFQDMISVDQALLGSAFGMDVDMDAISGIISDYLAGAMGRIDVDTGPASSAFSDTLYAMGSEMLHHFVISRSDPTTGEAVISLADVESAVEEYLSGGAAQAQLQALNSSYPIGEDAYTQVLRPVLSGLGSYFVVSEMADDLPQVPELPELPEVTLPEELPEVTLPELTLPTQPEPTETEPAETEPTETEPAETEPTETEPTETEPTQEAAPAPAAEPEVTAPSFSADDLTAVATTAGIADAVSAYMGNGVVDGVCSAMGAQMMESEIMDQVSGQLAGLGDILMGYVGSGFYLDESKFAEAFQFKFTEEELQRLMSAMANPGTEASAESNLRALGYADPAAPSAISVYFVDFAAKEIFLSFLDGYNDAMEEAGKEEQVIRYADVTGIMMSSVRTIIDSVSYALIAFVAVSLVVSSIMIGIITYISVMERTKEIGVLRAIGASKGNISQVFNAETFIIGLCSGLMGIGVTLLLLIPGNKLIFHLTENPDIVAQLPLTNAVVLILLSMVLTLIGGFIPAKQAAKKDPVIALRSE